MLKLIPGKLYRTTKGINWWRQVGPEDFKTYYIKEGAILLHLDKMENVSVTWYRFLDPNGHIVISEKARADLYLERASCQK